MRGREQLQCALPAGFLVAAAELMKLLPRGGLDDRQRDCAAGDHAFDRADGAAILEAGADALFWHHAGAFDERMLRRVLSDPIANSEYVDALFGAYAGDRNIDCIDELWGCAVGVDSYD